MSVPVAQQLLAAASETAPLSEASHCLWLAVLAQSLESLRDPACARLLGPLVPGATMAGGARVPGTSYDLDPAQAAFNATLLQEWTAPALPAERPGQLLVALLAVADYRSRRALAYGETPWSVRQFTMLVSRIEALRAAAPVVAQVSPATSALVRLRAACAVGAALLCNADEAQCGAALQLGCVAGPPVAPDSHAGSQWSILRADAAAQGVRLGLLAMRAGDDPGMRADSWQAALASMLAPLEVVHNLAGQPGIDGSAQAPAALHRFESAVTLHFPVVQADRIRHALSDRNRLAALGVHELLALLMRN